MQRVFKSLCTMLGLFCRAAELDVKIEHMSTRMDSIEGRIDTLEDKQKYWMPRDLIDVR